MPLSKGILGVLLDIEGTTTPISFVHDVLFPYAAARLEAFCATATSQPEAARAIEILRREHQQEKHEQREEPPAFGNGAAFARFLMDRDRKSTGLKMLQGLLWEAGYRKGELLGQVFADVPEALRAWRQDGVRLRVFSSGSVLAQKLLFSHTEHGDLTPFFEGFHDTTTGAKNDPAAYAAIAQAFGLAPEQVLFLSDMVFELDAAAAAGMATRLMLRPGNQPADHRHGPHAGCHDFRELLPPT